MHKKIYFCGSIRGGREDYKIYQELINYISDFAIVLTEHIGDVNVSGDHLLSDIEIHDRDMDWLRESDMIIAEVTQTSLGVGYEIGRAIELGKPVVCLYRQQKGRPLSAMITGSSEIQTFSYSDMKEAKEIIFNQLKTN
ncbi:MAG: nucleoside 2-deoxyribosyltransferase [Bacteroidetes bacterium]|jgi:2'-deoxynucleoside 5'-phosphate N-hydrolase|nr:nucleoside 2-deoxyribosyltransferase [Bacteroidota bacterium]MBT3748443.1 nucleoside 2-deoxyribosyltransferase [Bacteroidota bacterium]MBT4400713.1 nucleoside 2-deoxyribosyltransferase [Bacteroidota bacterium]MBT4408223.1 nucleoside 2-deoxyribosyltransferase [Bacteroidota bacterium]MBT5427627.1 nucleoside 2-deoxyribosyltransferase [Bacteroidota bacterium]